MTQISAEPLTRPTIATFGVRLGGYLIDCVCIAVVNFFAGILLLLAPSPIDTVLGIVLLLAWYALFWRLAHGTPGKLAVGVRIQPATGPGALSWWSILRRYAVQFGVPTALVTPVLSRPVSGDEVGTAFLWLLAMSLLSLCWTLLDCLWSLTNPVRQALHDKAAGTVVVTAA